MKLTAFVVNGTPISSRGRYDSSELGENVPFKREDTVSSGYEDISSITAWATHGASTGYDYKVVREEIAALVTSIGWESLDAGEKEIASKYFVVDKASRDEVYTTIQQIGLGLLHHKASVEARTLRYAKASMEVYNRLSPAESKVVIGDVADLGFKYVQYGIEGTVEGDPEGFFDYLEARSGTSYENTGLATKTYEPDGMTLAQLVTRLMDILKLGES